MFKGIATMCAIATLALVCSGCPESKTKQLEREVEELQIRLAQSEAARARLTWVQVMKDQWPSAGGWCLAFGLLVFLGGSMVGSGARRTHGRQKTNDTESGT